MSRPVDAEAATITTRFPAAWRARMVSLSAIRAASAEVAVGRAESARRAAPSFVRTR